MTYDFKEPSNRSHRIARQWSDCHSTDRQRVEERVSESTEQHTANTATHCNTLQHTATHCYQYRKRFVQRVKEKAGLFPRLSFCTFEKLFSRISFCTLERFYPRVSFGTVERLFPRLCFCILERLSPRLSFCIIPSETLSPTLFLYW